MALARRRRERGIDYWPGFVDALSTLILGIVFLLSVFVVVQFFLSQEVTGKDTALPRLNAQLAQLTEMLSLEKVGKANLEDTLASLRANLALSESERDRLKGVNEGLAQRRQPGERACRPARRAEEPRRRARWRRSSCSTSRSPRCAASLRRSRARWKPPRARTRKSQARIADLGQRLNLALAQRVQELSRFRSEFFGRLRAILGNRPDIRVVGDRFVFQSEVFFDAGSGGDAAGRPRRARQARERADRAREADPEGRRLGAARRRAHRRAADRERAVSLELGTFRRRARSRWCST